jgi:hypothetical protein
MLWQAQHGALIFESHSKSIVLQQLKCDGLSYFAHGKGAGNTGPNRKLIITSDAEKT